MMVRNYLIGIAVSGALLAADRFEAIDLGGFANGLALMIVVFAVLALAARGGAGKSNDD